MLAAITIATACTHRRSGETQYAIMAIPSSVSLRSRHHGIAVASINIPGQWQMAANDANLRLRSRGQACHMASDVARTEFDQLTTRVDVVEREVEGEKVVTRYILEQTRRNGDDLAAIKGRLDRVEGRLDGVEGRLDRVESKVDGLAQDLRGLVRNLPKIVSEAVRVALPAPRRKR
jgi:hypothetical protein